MLYRYLPYNSNLNVKADDILVVDHNGPSNFPAQYFIVEPNTKYSLANFEGIFPDPAPSRAGHGEPAYPVTIESPSMYASLRSTYGSGTYNWADYLGIYNSNLPGTLYPSVKQGEPGGVLTASLSIPAGPPIGTQPWYYLRISIDPSVATVILPDPVGGYEQRLPSNWEDGRGYTWLYTAERAFVDTFGSGTGQGQPNGVLDVWVEHVKASGEKWRPAVVPVGNEGAAFVDRTDSTIITYVGGNANVVRQLVNQTVLETTGSERSWYFAKYDASKPGYAAMIAEKHTFPQNAVVFDAEGYTIDECRGANIVSRFRVRPQHLQYSFLWDIDSWQNGGNAVAAGNAVQGAARIRGDVINSAGGVYYDRPVIIGSAPEASTVGANPAIYNFADVRPKNKTATVTKVGTNLLPAPNGRSAHFMEPQSMCDISGDYTFLSGNFTMEFWVKHFMVPPGDSNNSNSSYMILFDTTSPAQANAFRLYFNGDLYPVLGYNTQTFKLTQTVPTNYNYNNPRSPDQGPWHHIAISKNGDAIHTHVNGVSAGVFTVTTPAATYFQNAKIRWRGNGRSANGSGLPGLTPPGGVNGTTVPIQVKDLHFWSIPKYAGTFTPSYPVLWTRPGE